MSGQQGRLIINSRGESGRAINALPGNANDHPKGAFTIMVCVLADRTTSLPNGTVVSELVYAPREAAALALQILDAAGYCAEVYNAHTREHVRDLSNRRASWQGGGS